MTDHNVDVGFFFSSLEKTCVYLLMLVISLDMRIFMSSMVDDYSRVPVHILFFWNAITYFSRSGFKPKLSLHY